MWENTNQFDTRNIRCKITLTVSVKLNRHGSVRSRSQNFFYLLFGTFVVSCFILSLFFIFQKKEETLKTLNRAEIAGLLKTFPGDSDRYSWSNYTSGLSKRVRPRVIYSQSTGLFHRLGLEVGDIIVEINERAPSDPLLFESEMRSLPQKNRIKLDIRRGQDLRQLSYVVID